MRRRVVYFLCVINARNLGYGSRLINHEKKNVSGSLSMTHNDRNGSVLSSSLATLNINVMA